MKATLEEENGDRNKTNDIKPSRLFDARTETQEETAEGGDEVTIPHELDRVKYLHADNQTVNNQHGVY